MHAKSVGAQEVRALLTSRKLMQAKLLDVESGIRGAVAKRRGSRKAKVVLALKLAVILHRM